MKDKRLIHENKGGSYRDATQEEIDVATSTHETVKQLIKQINEAEEALAAIRKACTHEVVYDVAGHPWDTRICVACGHSSLL